MRGPPIVVERVRIDQLKKLIAIGDRRLHFANPLTSVPSSSTIL